MKKYISKEFKNTDLWILALFLGFFNNFIFYYIGIKSKCYKYIQCGHFFTFIWLLFITSLILKDYFFNTYMPIAYIFSYLAGIFLGFSTRKYYTYRLVLLEEAEHLNLINKKTDITDNYDLYYLINSKIPKSDSVFK